MFQFCSDIPEDCSRRSRYPGTASDASRRQKFHRVPAGFPNSVNKSLTSDAFTSRPSVAFRRRLFLWNRILSFSELRSIGRSPRKFKPLRDQRKRIKTGETEMKKFLLGTVGLVALSLSAPASAADLAARPYTKAPPMIAAVYDWSGFYVGVNGGWGSSRKSWDFVDAGRRVRRKRRQPRCNRRHRRRPDRLSLAGFAVGVRSGSAGQLG